LAISSAKSIGCVVVNIHPELIAEKREHIILGLTWQIIKIQLLSAINLKNHPFLIRLKKEDEEVSDLLKLAPEETLLRWFNYHLKNAGHNRKVTNFSSDLKDGENYVILLNQLDPQQCDKSGLDLQGQERTKKIIADSKKLGVPPLLKPSDILNGTNKLNLIFCAQIFNNCPGLVPNESDFEAAKILDDDNDHEASIDERSFRMWINSLGGEDF